MKKILFIAFFNFLMFPMLEAQEKVRFIYDVGIGTSLIPSTGNYSSWGAAYRNNFHSGLAANARAMYVWDNKTSAGIKLNMHSIGANYILESNKPIVDNVYTYYMAPQIGKIFMWRERCTFDLSIGAGYVYYNGMGLIGNSEYTNRSYLLGSNADMSFAYLIKKSTSVGIVSSFFTSIYSINNYRKTDNVEEKIEPYKFDKLNLSKIEFILFLRVSL